MNKGTFRINDEADMTDEVILEFSLKDFESADELEKTAQFVTDSCDGVITAEADLESGIIAITADADYAKEIARKVPAIVAGVNLHITVLPANELAGSLLKSADGFKVHEPSKQSFLSGLFGKVAQVSSRPARSSSSSRPETASAAIAGILGGEGSSAVLLTTLAALVLLAIHFLAKAGGVLDYIVCILAVLLTGYTVVIEAVGAVKRKNFFDNSLLIAVTALLSCCLNRFFLAAALLYMFRMFGFVTGWAHARMSGVTKNFNKLLPREINIIDGTGQMQAVPAGEVKPGDIAVVLPGERIPVDGTVIQGSGVMSTYDLSGLKSPVNAMPGSFVTGGMMNPDATLKIRVSSTVDTSAPAVMNDMLRDMPAFPAESESKIAKISKYMTPCALALAFLVAVVPSIAGGNFGSWLGTALTLLVAASPCALVMSSAAGFKTAISACAGSGMMLRGGRTVQLLSECRAAVFGRTGTLTRGNLSVSQVFSSGRFRDNQVLAFAAIAESGINNPVARAICSKAGNPECPPCEREEFPNMGVKAVVSGHTICVGSAKMMLELGANVSELGNFTSYVSLDGTVIGALLVSDDVRVEAASCVKDLKDIGVTDLFMLTGCNLAEATETCRSVGIEKAEHSVTPDKKIEILDKIKEACGITVYVSDGVGEAEVLTTADVGIATGFSDHFASSGADGIITGDRLTSLSKSVDLCTKATSASQINIIFAVCAKLVGIICGLIWGEWIVLLFDILTIVFAVLNSGRILPKSKRPAEIKEQL